MDFSVRLPEIKDEKNSRRHSIIGLGNFDFPLLVSNIHVQILLSKDRAVASCILPVLMAKL